MRGSDLILSYKGGNPIVFMKGPRKASGIEDPLGVQDCLFKLTRNA